MRALPIDPLLPELVRAFGERRALVLEAPPGAGKTTRVPVALLDAGFEGEILVLEPRRLAARLAARHVAKERGERVGETIGYSVRFEDASSRRTRVRYVTEGVFLRQLLDDPELSGVGAVMLDEFHERHLATDLALVLGKRLRERRPELGLVVMSATLEAEPVARYLGGVPRLQSEGRMFPVEIEHIERPDDRPLEKQVSSAVRRLISELPGDVLVFLPGAAEIRRATQALEPLAAEAGLLLLPLHGELPLADQARAVEPSERRKLILSTNVAESSVTIDGVVGVVDSGLARIASHSPWTGLPRLSVGKISRASAAQRAGRAGRTRPGKVLRLYTKGDLGARPAAEEPELLRLDLSETLLTLHGAGITDPEKLDWFERPKASALGAAETLLRALGALDDRGALSDVGRRLLSFAVHPRLARVIVEGERRGVGRTAALIAALLGERDIRLSERVSFGRRGSLSGVQAGSSDVLELVERFEAAEAENFDARALREQQLDSRTVAMVDRAYRQLSRSTRDRAEPPDDTEPALLRAVLAGFVDRVAKRRKPGGRELVLASGATSTLSEASVVERAPLLVAIDVESSRSVVRLASAIEAEWLLDDHAELLSAGEFLEWNEERERVERVSRVACGSVILEESRTPAEPSPEAAAILARAARARGLHALVGDEVERLVARIAFLRDALPALGLPALSDDALGAALDRACAERASFAELAKADLGAALLGSLERGQQRALAEQAPDRLTLPGGRSVLVHYERGKPPWVESRLQDFFGMGEAPRLAGVPLVLHLLAPNGRAVQVTQDLAGFWQRHYPALRRELGRRYPKHAWPEDGRHASPPRGRRS